MPGEYESLVLYVGKLDENIRELRTLLSGLHVHRIRASDAIPQQVEIDFKAVPSQKRALHIIRVQAPDIVVIETDIKQESRIRFCRDLRLRIPGAAVVAAGARRPRKRASFDHFLHLPIHTEETLRLLKSLLESRCMPVLQAGPIHLHLTHRRVSGPAGTFRLPPKQAALLQIFLSRPDQTVGRDELMQAIWKTSYMGDTRTLDVHIRWLRQKIEPDPSQPIFLLTVRGIGFRYCHSGTSLRSERSQE